MHKVMLAEYRRLFSRMDLSGSILEVGATPDNKSLLSVPELRGAKERIGLNLDGPHDFGGFHIDQGDAHAMPYPDERFDVVICNAVMEHVDEPLVVMAEIKRVTKPGGLIVIGMPGFRRVAFEKVQGKLKKILPRFLHNPLLTFTIVYQRHDEPVDNWRPSLRCVRDVFMKGLESVEVWSVMMPPRLIGVGRKPH